MRRPRARALWTLIALAILLLAGILASRPRELVEGVWTADVGACSIDYHPSLRALALACPGVDYLRLWPWPVEQPWEEPGRPLESPSEQRARDGREWQTVAGLGAL